MSAAGEGVAAAAAAEAVAVAEEAEEVEEKVAEAVIKRRLMEEAGHRWKAGARIRHRESSRTLLEGTRWSGTCQRRMTLFTSRDGFVVLASVPVSPLLSLSC